MGSNTYSGNTILTGSGRIEIKVNSVGSVGAITSSGIGTGTLVLNGGCISGNGGYNIYNPVTFQADSTLGYDGGALNFQGPCTLVAAPGKRHVNDSKTYSGRIGDGGSGYGLTVYGGLSSVTLTLSGTNTYSGDTRIRQGTLKLGSSLALQNSTLNMLSTTDSGTISFGSLTSATLGGLSGSRNVIATGVALTVGGNNIGETYSGVLSGTGASLQKAGTGNLLLSGPNTYSGGTTITSGRIQIGVDSAGSVGSITSGATGTGTIVLNGGGLCESGARNVYNPVTFQADTQLGYYGGTLTLQGAGTLVGGTRTLTTTGGDTIIYSGAIGDGGSGYGLITQVGTTFILSGSNTYSGDTRSHTGTLTLGNSAALQNSTLNMSSSDGGSVSFGSLTAATLGGLSGSRNLNATGVALNVGGNNVAETYSGVLSGTGASLEKAGTGTLTLSNANTYTGPTVVSNGTLVLSQQGDWTHNGTIDHNSAVTINSGGTILCSAGNALGEYNSLGDGIPAVTINTGGVLTVASTMNGNLDRLDLEGGALARQGSDEPNFGTWQFNNNVTAGTASANTSTISATGCQLTANSGGSVAFTVGTGSTLNVTGSFGGTATYIGTSNLVKAGAGTMILASANTYTARQSSTPACST